MLVRPHTLSIITTHQCTAACDHCCFSCTPKITKAIPYERMVGLIDEAAQLPGMRLVVFTGGECFLLGTKLDVLIARATEYGLITRCVTNGYWATSRQAAEKRLDRLTAAGLKEINFSTGTFHAQYVPVERIVHGAYASAQAGLTTLVNIEICNESDFDVGAVTKHPDLVDMIADHRVIIQRNVWIESDGSSSISHAAENSRFNDNRKSGCSTVLNVLTVTPDQSLVACCGLHLEKIPDLHLGSVADSSIGDLLNKTPDDFLKIWIHVEGPERILEFVKKYVPNYKLPLKSVHPCETCLHLYQDERAKAILREHYREVESEVTSMYLAGIAAGALSTTLDSFHKSSAE